MPSVKYVSFFSGCGGGDIGLSQAGFTCLAAVDNNQDALAISRQNLPGIPHLSMDLRTQLPPESLLSDADMFMITPPCQGFSTMAGKEFNDNRNELIDLTGYLVTSYTPRAFVVENVAGAIGSRHGHRWYGIAEMLRRIGYSVATFKVDMSRFGVPQARTRAIMVGRRWASRPELGLSERLPVTAGEALKNVDGLPDHNPEMLDPGSRPGRIARHIRQGEKLCNVRNSPRAVRTWSIPEVFGRTSSGEREILELVSRLRRTARRRTWGDADPVPRDRLERTIGRVVEDDVRALVERDYLRIVDEHIDITHTFNGKFRRLRENQPAPTVDSRYTDPHYFLHPTEHRAPTVREAARLQTFPDSFRFPSSKRAATTMIANAVPPDFAQNLGSALLHSLRAR